jgi:ATP-dependent helicase/nuclease subunit A
VSAAREPTREQAEAIGVRGRDVLLEAGAGTGKTGVLVDRYCDLVASDGVSPDAILAFTFTDKAAAQLRERARDELRRRETDEPQAAEDLDALVAGFGGALITTIHGFCRRLLAAHPVAAGIDPRFRVLDQSEASRAAGAAFDAALEDFLADGDPEREATVAAYYVDGLRAMVAAAYEELRSRGLQTPQLPDPPAADLASAMDKLEAAATEALGAPGGSGAQRGKMEQALELCVEQGQLPSLDELAVLDFGKPKGARGECAKALRAAIAAAAASGEGGVVYEHLRELLGLFGKRFAEQKAARAGLDFEDLQLLAVRLLTESEVGEQYRARFSHLMVDEFQDTNRLQLKLIEALRGPDTELFLVGDEFQSIYGFRHADLAVFREQRQRFSASRGAALLPLSGNFRSRPEVVATANAIGSRMLEGFNPLTVGSPDSKPLAGGPAVELLLTERKGWDAEGIELQLPVDDRTPKESVAEARFLAARLRELTEEHGVARGDIVLLLRAFTRVDAFEEALERAGLRPYVVGGRGYWSQQQVEDVRCLLSVVANPLDDEPLLGALASPACGVLPDTLWILRRASGSGKHLWRALERAVGAWEPELAEPEWLDQIPEADLERLKLFHGRITALRDEAPTLGLEELVDRVVADTGYDVAVLMRHSGELRLANLRKLMRMAREFEANEGRNLRAFLDFVSFRTAEDDEAVAATEAEDHDGVRVMTIHNAKGLEFPVVAVGGLGRDLLGGGRPPDLILGRGQEGAARIGMRLARLGAASVDLYEKAALQEEAAELDSAEELRLFYVAATRAQERLLLSGVMAPERPKELKPGTPVSERLLRAFGIEELEHDSTISLPAAAPAPGLEADLPDPTIAVRVNRPSPERAAELVRVASAEVAPTTPGGGPPPIVEPRSPVTPRRPLSYTALARHRRCGYRFYIETVLDLTPVNLDGTAIGRSESQEFGEAVHQLLEWSSGRKWIEPPEELARRYLAARDVDLDGGALQRANEMVRGWLDSPLRAELATRGTKTKAEVRFLIELGGSHVRGTLDLLAEPRDGQATVVDFKTDRLEGADPEEHAQRYEIQRDLYALATVSATEAESVRVAYVYLERPDQPVTYELDRAATEKARADLERTVAEIAAGRFEVTSTPDWPLCRDCPARQRLCSAPASPPGE